MSWHRVSGNFDVFKNKFIKNYVHCTLQFVANLYRTYNDAVVNNFMKIANAPEAEFGANEKTAIQQA
jgi:hypothetical protein